MAATQAFKDAVRNNNLMGVHIMMTNSMVGDPTFKEFNEMEKIASTMKDLFVPHDGREFEMDKSKWDEEYLARMQAQLMSNFSKERVEHLKEVVRYVFPEDDPRRFNRESNNIINRIKFIQGTENKINKNIGKMLKILEDEYSTKEDTMNDPRNSHDDVEYDKLHFQHVKKAIDATHKLSKTLIQMDKYIDSTFGKYKDYADNKYK